MKPVDRPLSRLSPFTSVDAHFAAGYFRISNPSPVPSASKRGQSIPWQNHGAPPSPAAAAPPAPGTDSSRGGARAAAAPPRGAAAAAAAAATPRQV